MPTWVVIIIIRPLQVVFLFLVLWSACMLLAIFRLSASSIICILHVQSRAKIFYWHKITFQHAAGPHDPWKHPGTESEIPLIVVCWMNNIMGMNNNNIINMSLISELWSTNHLIRTPRSLQIVSCPDPPFSAALDVLHHQRAEGRVWKLLHGFCVHQECN